MRLMMCPMLAAKVVGWRWWKGGDAEWRSADILSREFLIKETPLFLGEWVLDQTNQLSTRSLALPHTPASLQWISRDNTVQRD